MKSARCICLPRWIGLWLQKPGLNGAVPIGRAAAAAYVYENPSLRPLCGTDVQGHAAAVWLHGQSGEYSERRSASTASQMACRYNEIPQRLIHRAQQCFGEAAVLTRSPAFCDPDFLLGNQIDRQPEMPVSSQQVGLFGDERWHWSSCDRNVTQYG